MTQATFSSSIPILGSVAEFREWRQRAHKAGQSVGFVPTMGALHRGHLSLVEQSASKNDLTVVSIFVNPAQFAPHEDLATYPRTLPDDLAALEKLSPTASAVFVPSVKDMYPSGITQVVGDQKGAFVEVKGFGHQMEGMSRPTFFRGVATVVTKLFNIVQPTRAYFGQKDIQQGLLLRRMVRDLLMAYPSPENLHIIPTHRSTTSGLALSSRNVYLTPPELEFAPTLYQALKAGEVAWKAGAGREGTVDGVKRVMAEREREAVGKGVEMRLDYVTLNDGETLDVVEGETGPEDGKPVILSGALWVGKTRLIDNIILGDSSSIFT